MDVIVKLLQFILSLSLLVFVHELGHYLFARLFGMRVEKFYLFFYVGKPLVRFTIGETEYGIGWIPFGGYVKIAGMVDESMDKEQMKQKPKSYEFRSKSAWKRLIVILGGVFMNVVMALCIYVGMSWKHGESYIANDEMVYGWQFSELGHEIGFENGDRILLVGDKRVESFASVYPEIVINKGPDVTVLRGEDTLRLQIPTRYLGDMLQDGAFMYPRYPFVIAQVVKDGGADRAGIVAGDSIVGIDDKPLLYFDQAQEIIKQRAGESVEISLVRREQGGIERADTLTTSVSEEGMIGVAPKYFAEFFNIKSQKYTFWQAIPAGFIHTGEQLSNYWKQLKMIASPSTRAYKAVSGPVGIVNIFPKVWNWDRFWDITAILSIALAIMNILPIPMLDGGHALFILYEMLTGRKPSDRAMEISIMIGFFLLMTLLILITGNDIIALFTK